MESPIIHLSSGIRVVYKPTDVPITHACITINTGSRDEAVGEFGMAHFIEHLLFKKTERRSTTQILNHLELVGADLNAYTTKEYTCIHASFLNQHLYRTLNLFEDIVFHSVFPENEIEKEKDVILDEIFSYQDSPEEAIMDDFEDLLFNGHALGHNILGTEESVSSLRKRDIIDFFKANYTPENIIVSITGNYSLPYLTKAVNKYFGSLQSDKQKPLARLQPLQYEPKKIAVHKSINQVHTVIGNQAYSTWHKHRTGMALLNNLLGGGAMTSRLNMEIREKRGIAYTIESAYVPYQDTGVFSVYFGTDVTKAERAEALVLKEFKKLREKKMNPIRLNQAKKRFIGQIALAEENRLALIIAMAKNVHDYGHIESLADIFNKIEKVTAADLLEISNEVFDINQLCTLSFKP